MFDCGIHPGFTGLNSLPFLDLVDLDKVDVALITHFHLDHCAAVPYLLTKTKFKARTGGGNKLRAMHAMRHGTGCSGAGWHRPAPPHACAAS